MERPTPSSESIFQTKEDPLKESLGSEEWKNHKNNCIHPIKIEAFTPQLTAIIGQRPLAMSSMEGDRRASGTPHQDSGETTMRHKATAAALEETPSTLLQGRFEVIKELGRGAGGVVYLVMDRLRRAQVVLKHLWHTPEDADLQAQEATESFNMLARLHHSALPVLLDWGRDAQGRVFYTRPFAPGENGDKLAGELNPDQVAQIAYQLIEVIGQLHRSKYCHGDIKPQNILLDVSAESIDVHLIDFGLIFQTGDVDTGVRGTPLYLAPELLRGATPGIATDLYALGATLYHLFYGVPPFHGVDEHQSSTTFKSDMDAVLVDRILHEAPEHPPQGWESTSNPKHNASQDVLAQLIRSLMSPQHTTRANAIDGALGLLAPWAPAVPQQAPSCFVGREKELDQLMAWVDDNIDQVAKTLPIALLEGPAGIGKRTLVNIAATNIKQRNVILLEHTAVDAEPDKTLEELARQLLISRPDVLGQSATALLRELSLNETGEIGTFGGEHARQLRLMRHLMKAARHTPLFIVINGLTPNHATLDTLISLANHLSADRTRPAPTNLAIIATITPGLPPAANDQSADSTQTIKPLSASCLQISLPPLTALETREFLEQTLPIHARPTSPEETQHLTEGIPLRLTTMAQALLEASKQGQKPSGVTLRRAADLNGEQQRRINRLRPPLRAVLKALALTKRPTSLRLLQTILPEYTLRNSTMEYLHQQGILHTINKANTDQKTNPNTQYHIISNELNTTILDASWSDIPNTNTIISRLAQTLYDMYTEHSASVEPLEMLQWLTKSGQRERVLQHGPHICRVYRQNQRLQAAHASIELILDCLPDDWTKQNETILIEALETYNNLEISEKIEEIGDKLLERWSETNAIPKHILDAFNDDDDDQEDFLKKPWEQHIKLVPGPTPSSQQTVVTAYARALALLAINPTRKTLYSRAMRRVWALIPYFSGQNLPYVWGPLLRALMARLWRTSYRTDVLHAAIRLTNAEHIFERLNSEQQAEMLNFKGALFEQEQLLEEAQQAYENAIFTGRRRGFVATVVARATSNLVRMLSNSGQTAVARYHLERCIKECEELGYEHVRMGLLQRLAQIQTESGHPYAGMMSIEAAYRVALSSGRYDLLSNIGISLLFYYGKFGFEEKNRSLFERMKSQPMWKDRWEIYMQQGLCLIGWQHTTQSLQVIKEIKKKFTDQSLTQTGKTALHMLTGEYMLLKQEWGQAVRESSQGLAMLRKARLEPTLKLESLRVLVEAHIRLGNTGEAEQRLEECFDLIKNHELNTDLPQYHHLRGQLYRAMDRPEDAQHAFLKANEILQERLEEMPEAYRKGYLKNRRRTAILNDAQQHAQLDRHRLLSGLQQILDIVQKLHRASRRTLDALMSEVLDQIINFTGANRGILFQIEPTPDPGTETNPEGTLIERTWESDDDGLPLGWISSVAFARGFGQQDLTNRRIRTSSTVIQRVLRENAPISSADATEDLRFSRSGSIATMGMRSILAFPLRNEGHINGVVYLDSERTRQFSKEDEELLDMLGNQLGPVVQRAQHRALVRAVTDRFPRIIGQSDAMVEILNTAQKVANTNVPVLILGDTGTGKELLARGIHDASGRARAPFVAVNCATLPENLVEAELFGAQRGAYTGAQTRPGFFEQANGGTLFLDEIGDLPMAAQAKILRALQEGTIRRLGDQRERNVDVRIIAATHWDLHKRVKEGLFRTDLFYRLNVVTLRLPTLEQRPEDIPALVHFFFNLFVEQHNLDMAPPSPKIIQTLQRSSWPGNIRQLRNALQRAMILCHGNELTLEAIYTAADEVEDLEELEELPSPAQETHPAHNTAAPGMPHNPWAHFPPPGATPPQYQHGMWPPPGSWPQPPAYPTTPPSNPYAAYGHSPYPPNWPPPWANPWATQAPYPQNWQAPPWMMQSQPPHPGAPAAPAQPAPQPAQEPDGPEEPMNMARAKARQRYQTVQRALAQTNGNKAQAARLLGITRQSIYRILERGPE